MIRFIAWATLINAALIAVSFYPPAIVTQAGRSGFWPYAISHPADAATVLIALFNLGLVFVTYRLVNSTDKLWETAIEESRRAHRAKLEVRRVHNPQFHNEQPIAIMFDLINHGVRDAIIIESGSDIFIRPKDPAQSRSFDATFRPAVPRVTLKPGEMHTVVSIGKNSLTFEALGKIKSGELDAVLIANIQYLDEAGSQMVSIFRIYDHELGCFRRAETSKESQEWEYTD